MSSKSGRIEHLGVVEEIKSQTILVRIASASACGSCHAKGSCGMAEVENKQITVANDGSNEYKVGETVNVVMRTSTGLKSVLYAYVLPVALLLLSLLIFSEIGLNEGASALFSLVTVAFYYFGLYLLRKRVSKKITMKIEKYY